MEDIERLVQPHYAWLGIAIVFAYVFLFTLIAAPQILKEVRSQIQAQGYVGARSILKTAACPVLLVPSIFVGIAMFPVFMDTIQCTTPESQRIYCSGSKYDDMCFHQESCNGIEEWEDDGGGYHQNSYVTKVALRSFGSITTWFNVFLLACAIPVLIFYGFVRFFKTLGAVFFRYAGPPLRKFGGWIGRQRGRIPVRW